MAVSELPAWNTATRAKVSNAGAGKAEETASHGEVELCKALIFNMTNAPTIRYENDLTPGAPHKFTALYGDGTTRTVRFTSLENALQPVYQRAVGSAATTTFAIQAAFDGTEPPRSP